MPKLLFIVLSVLCVIFNIAAIVFYPLSFLTLILIVIYNILYIIFSVFFGVRIKIIFDN